MMKATGNAINDYSKRSEPYTVIPLDDKVHITKYDSARVKSDQKFGSMYASMPLLTSSHLLASAYDETWREVFTHIKKIQPSNIPVDSSYASSSFDLLYDFDYALPYDPTISDSTQYDSINNSIMFNQIQYDDSITNSAIFPDSLVHNINTIESMYATTVPLLTSNPLFTFASDKTWSMNNNIFRRMWKVQPNNIPVDSRYISPSDSLYDSTSLLLFDSIQYDSITNSAIFPDSLVHNINTIESMYATTVPLLTSNPLFTFASDKTWSSIFWHSAGMPLISDSAISYVASLQNIQSGTNLWHMHQNNLINDNNLNSPNTFADNYEPDFEIIDLPFQNLQHVSEFDINLDDYSDINSHNTSYSAVPSQMSNIDGVLMSLSSYLTLPNHGFGLHTDSHADFLASHYDADAITIGHDIFFRNDKFDPSTIEGFGLLVHEITHITQLEDQAKVDDNDVLTEERWEREAINNENKAIVDYTNAKSQQTYTYNTNENSTHSSNVAHLTYSAGFNPTLVHHHNHSNHLTENNSNNNNNNNSPPVLAADSKRETSMSHVDDESVDTTAPSINKIVDAVYEKILLKIKEQKERRGW